MAAVAITKYLLAAVALHQMIVSGIGIPSIAVKHAYQRECIELQCPRSAIRKHQTVHVLLDEVGQPEACRICQQCTANGFSVCLSVREETRSRRESAPSCICEHSIPASCDTRPGIRPTNSSFAMHNICYLSSMQMPPTPHAVQHNHSLLVTIDEFWTNTYWRELEPANLTLYYEFQIEKDDHCDGELGTKGNGEQICSGSLQIEIGDDDETNKDTTGDYDQTHTYDDEYEENAGDETGPPEIQFDREVFGKAKQVEFWYAVRVRRPRQLNMKTPEEPFIDKNTAHESEHLYVKLNFPPPDLDDDDEEPLIRTSGEGVAVHGDDNEYEENKLDKEEDGKKINQVEKNGEKEEHLKEKVKEESNENKKTDKEKEDERVKENNENEKEDEKKDDERVKENNEKSEQLETKSKEKDDDDDKELVAPTSTPPIEELEETTAMIAPDDPGEKGAEEVESEISSTIDDTSESRNTEKEQEEKEEESFWEQHSRLLSADSWWLVRVLAVSSVVCLATLLLIVCIYRKRRFCCHSRLPLKGGNGMSMNGSQHSGYQYQAATQQTRELLSSERDRLHQ